MHQRNARSQETFSLISNPHLIQLAYFVKCKGTIPNHIKVHEENEFCYCLFTTSQNVKLGIFTGIRAVQKSVMHVQSCCFALSSYYLFEFLIAAAS